MDLFDGVASAFRRWYVLLPILVLTALVALVVNNRKTTEYSSSAIIGVTTSSTSVASSVPSGSPTVERSNALIGNGGINLIANLLTIGMKDPRVQQAVVAAGGSPSYSIDVVQYGAAGQQLPVVTLTSTGDDARQVATTMRVLSSQANGVLNSIQQGAGVPSDRSARSYTVRPASTPARATLSTARNVGIVIVVGVLVGLIVAAAVDNLISRRRRRAVGQRVMTNDYGSRTGAHASP